MAVYISKMAATMVGPNEADTAEKCITRYEADLVENALQDMRPIQWKNALQFMRPIQWKNEAVPVEKMHYKVWGRSSGKMHYKIWGRYSWKAYYKIWGQFGAKCITCTRYEADPVENVLQYLRLIQWKNALQSSGHMHDQIEANTMGKYITKYKTDQVEKCTRWDQQRVATYTGYSD